MVNLLKLFAVACLGCGGLSSTPPSTVTPSLSSKGNSPIVAPSRKSIEGRVLLEGSPVEYFGTVLSKSYASVSQPPVMIHRSRDGRFSLEGIAPGAWDLIIVGPGFARKILSNLEIHESKTLDLADVSVSRGFAIKGRVLDATGPVGSASVKLMQGVESEDPMTDLVRGNHITNSNSNGDFEIDGFSIVDMAGRKARLTVTAPNGAMSFVEYVGAGNQQITVMVEPTGSIEGTVRSGNKDVMLTLIRPSRPREPLLIRLPTSSYQVTVPAGVYDLSIFAMSGSAPSIRKRVTIVAGSNTIVDFP